jgi:hypothetical protein
MAQTELRIKTTQEGAARLEALCQYVRSRCADEAVDLGDVVGVLVGLGSDRLRASTEEVQRWVDEFDATKGEES